MSATGRAGRTGPGVCYRLYNETTFNEFEPYSQPEIQRCSLDSLVLQLKALGMIDPRKFTFITEPPLLHMNAALHNLATLGATTTAITTVSSTTARTTVMDSISEDDCNNDTPVVKAADTAENTDNTIKATDTTESTDTNVKTDTTATADTANGDSSCDDVVACAQLTQLGHALVRLPVEPLIGKMLIIGVLLGVAEHAQLIAAILTVQSPFESARSASSSSNSSSSGIKRFYNVHGDAFSCADAYRAWIRVKADRKVSSRRWCKSHGIKEQRLYEISKLVTQYGDLLRDLKYSAGLIVLAFTNHSKPNRVSKAQIRQLRADQDVTLHMLDSNELSNSNNNGGSSSSTQHNTDAAQLQDKHDLLNEQSIHMAKTSSNRSGGASGKRSRIDVNSIEFYAQHSTDALSTVATSVPTHSEIALLKAIICAGKLNDVY
jgi:HrpA-like RNA helicase